MTVSHPIQSPRSSTHIWAEANHSAENVRRGHVNVWWCFSLIQRFRAILPGSTSGSTTTIPKEGQRTDFLISVGARGPTSLLVLGDLPNYVRLFLTSLGKLCHCRTRKAKIYDVGIPSSNLYLLIDFPPPRHSSPHFLVQWTAGGNLHPRSGCRLAALEYFIFCRCRRRWLISL